MHQEKQDLDHIFREQTKNRVSVGNTTYRERKKKLKTLLKTFLEMEDEALSALHKDMKKSKAAGFRSLDLILIIAMKGDEKLI